MLEISSVANVIMSYNKKPREVFENVPICKALFLAFAPKWQNGLQAMPAPPDQLEMAPFERRKALSPWPLGQCKSWHGMRHGMVHEWQAETEGQ